MGEVIIVFTDNLATEEPLSSFDAAFGRGLHPLKRRIEQLLHLLGCQRAALIDETEADKVLLAPGSQREL